MDRPLLPRLAEADVPAVMVHDDIVWTSGPFIHPDWYRRYGTTHFFVGNADTCVLLSGTRDQIRSEVERCMSIGKACPGFIMAVGNHIPANTPVESALHYNEVYNKLSKR